MLVYVQQNCCRNPATPAPGDIAHGRQGRCLGSCMCLPFTPRRHITTALPCWQVRSHTLAEGAGRLHACDASSARKPYNFLLPDSSATSDQEQPSPKPVLLTNGQVEELEGDGADSRVKLLGSQEARQLRQPKAWRDVRAKHVRKVCMQEEWQPRHHRSRRILPVACVCVSGSWRLMPTGWVGREVVCKAHA